MSSPLGDAEVHLVQEWLVLHGAQLEVDGAYGPKTQAALHAFQAAHGLVVTDTIDDLLLCILQSPLWAARERLPAHGCSLAEMTVSYARQHLVQCPREVGGPNCGPWVRLYMGGHEGPAWPWCAGFACFIVQQAAATLGQPLPFSPSFSCDALGADAHRRGLLGTRPEPGCLFLVRRPGTLKCPGWHHTGIVAEVLGEELVTIEGNTNEDGGREGCAVLERRRPLRNLDYITLKGNP